MRRTVAALSLLLIVGLGMWLWLRVDGTGTSDAGARGRRVLLIGIDGADWDILDPLIEAGRLPHLSRLKAEGVSGDLRTLTDIPLSPVIWTSVATGKVPAKHGITWFLVDTPDGRRVPVRSYNRKVKALWNMLVEGGREPGFVGWWASSPAEDVGEGVIASDALGFHGFGRTGAGMPDEEKVHPSYLVDELAVLVPPVQQIDWSFGERFFHMDAKEYYRRSYSPGRARDPSPLEPIRLFQEYTATTLGYTAIAKHLLEVRELDMLGVYFEASDSMSHLFMKYAPPRLSWVEERDFEKYRDVVDRYYEFVDEQVGQVLDSVPDDWAVFVVSDHGFRTGADRPKSVRTVDMRGAHLDHDPEGIFIATGPHLRAGATVQGATVLDVAPTLLHYLGLPVGQDMDGRVLVDVFREGFLDEHPIEYIPTYEWQKADAGPAPSPTEADLEFDSEDAMARLSTLGYAGGSEPPAREETDGAPGEERLTGPEQHNNLGRILLAKGELDAALAEFRKALEASPGNSQALLNIGLVHLAGGRQDLALRSFTEALQHQPNDVQVLMQLAEVRKARGELPLAEAFYRQVLAIDARLPAPYLGLGDALLRQGKVAAAKALFEKAAELDPLMANAHYNLGVARQQLGEKEAAKASYTRALEIDERHALALNNLGDLLLGEGQTDAALEHFRRAAEVAPGHMESRFNLGAIRLQAGEHEEAIRWLTEAANLAPDVEMVQDRLASAYLQSGNRVEARQRYEMIVRLFPASPAPCLQLARIAIQEGNEEQALGWLRVAWRRGGDPVARLIREDATFAALDLKKLFDSRGK